jgi:prepilin-type N-terminal cleavage/methylation domain-containing protein
MTTFATAFHPLGKHRRIPGNGFVLIEVLVSMTVFSVGIMAVLTAVLSALDLQKDSTLRYRAGLILQEKLAETALVPYSGQPMRGISADGVFSWTVAGEPWTGAPQVGKKKAKTVRKPRTSRGRVKTEEPETENTSSRLFQVSVDVSWQAGKGTRSINATQLVHVSLQAKGAP